MWPGLVGKGPGSEPAIGLDTMLDLTAAGCVNETRFDGVDLFLSDPHIGIDSTRGDLECLADKLRARNFVAGSLVAPVWPGTGGGSAMGTANERSRFLQQIEKACRIGSILREMDIRPYGVIRIDSSASPADWIKSPAENTVRIAGTFREACAIAESHGERLAAEGEICWAAMHSCKRMVQLLEAVDRPQTLGFQADMAHTLLYALGYNSPEDRILPQNFGWNDEAALYGALETVASALRPWTIDFHVAQNDGTVKGSGSHDKTGHHCLPWDPHGKLDIVRASALWLRDEQGRLTKAVQHICWDGCMFPNKVMLEPQTWNEVLRTMISVRAAHGWSA
ncbi:MAG: TIM barrel protein [Acidobacteriaceae bacterium]|nr:TIM barrel protein [Acidobacteriaceae bacterium]